MTGYFLRLPTDELRTYLRNSTLLQERVDALYPGEPDVLVIDDMWEGLLYILTGAGIDDESDDPLAKIIISKKIIDEDQDLGYGPATYVNPEEVIDLNRALLRIDRDDLEDRFDPDAMNDAGIYPEGWSDGVMLDLLLDAFDNVKTFYAAAAANEDAIIAFVI